MAKVKRNKKEISKTLTALQKKTSLIDSKITKDISSKLRLGESYISLALGAIVVLGISIVAFFFIKESGFNNTSPTINESKIPSVQTPTQQSYVLREGESLWDVAVKFYGDGFRYTEIVEANKLENPDYVPPGTKLIIPNTK